jgi:hypothetical protein
MIVVPEVNGLRLVRQPDHARMSAEIAAAWRRPESFSPAIWGRFIEAARRHDDGWTEEERLPALAPDGSPCDFKNLHAGHHAAVWRRSIELAERRDPYQALLVAQHARWLYSAPPAGAPAADRRLDREFAAELEARIARLVERLSAGSPEERRAVSPAERLRARRLLGFFDVLSLSLLGALGPIRSTERLPCADREVGLGLRYSGAEAGIEPWPFRRTAVRTLAPVIRLARRTFASPQDLAAEIERSPIRRAAWRLRPREQSPRA